MDWQTIITILAGAYNCSIIVTTRGFTYGDFFEIDPLFDRNGCFLILLWGLSHISVAWKYDSVPFLFLVFAFEKLVYVIHWISWLRKRETWIDKVKGTDFNTQVFFHLYGLLDAVFFIPALFAIFVMGVL
jgi:hypothetical protein